MSQSSVKDPGELQLKAKDLEAENAAHKRAAEKVSELEAQVVELERRLKSSAGEVHNRGNSSF